MHNISIYIFVYTIYEKCDEKFKLMIKISKKIETVSLEQKDSTTD